MMIFAMIVVLSSEAYLVVSAARMLRRLPSTALLSYIFFIAVWYALQLYMAIYLFSPVFLPEDSMYGYLLFNSIFIIPFHGVLAYCIADLTFRLLGSTMPRILRLILPAPFVAVFVVYSAGVFSKLAIDRSPETFVISAPVSGIMAVIVLFAVLAYGAWRGLRSGSGRGRDLALFAALLGGGNLIGLVFIFDLLPLGTDLQNGLSIIVCSAATIPAWFPVRRILYSEARSAAEELSKADLSALEDRFGISPREREIVSLVITGCSNREIVGKLFISEETVKKHIYNIYKKMGVRSRVQLVNAVLSVCRRI